MMKSNIIKIFNAQLRENVISTDELIELISIYLTEKYPERDISELVTFIANQPSLIQIIFPKLVTYFTKKYNITYITFNNKILLYYD